MSMEIPWDQPLTPEARQYLMDRGQEARVQQMDADYPPAEDADTRVVTPNDDWTPASGLEAVPTSELLAELDRREAAGENVWNTEDAEVNEDTEPTDNYDTRTVADLGAELRSRGLSDSGKKAELIERLRENDSVQAL